MCSVSEILYKKATVSGFGRVGDDLVKMLESMTRCGKDSNGITKTASNRSPSIGCQAWAS